jgi:hypothetical protein
MDARPLRVGCMFVLIAFGAFAALTVLALIPPAARPVLPGDAVARGEALEQALVAAVTKVRDPAGETWAIAIDPADVNAWLATTVRISAADGALIVDAPVGPEAIGLVGTLRLPVALEDSPDAKLLLDIGAARIGLLPVPISDAGWEAAGALADELARFEARYPERRFRLADGRFVEVRAISCEDGRIKIRFATLPAAASGG